MAKSTKKLYFAVQFDVDFDGKVIGDAAEALSFENLNEAKKEVESWVQQGLPEESCAIYEGNLLIRPKSIRIEWE